MMCADSNISSTIIPDPINLQYIHTSKKCKKSFKVVYVCMYVYMYSA